MYKEKIIIGNATLYLGDCLDILPEIKKVDCILSEIPAGQNLGRYPYDESETYSEFIKKLFSVLPEYNLCAFAQVRNINFDYLFEGFKEFNPNDFSNFKKTKLFVYDKNEPFKLIYKGNPSLGVREKIYPTYNHLKEYRLGEDGIQKLAPQFKYLIDCFTATNETVLDLCMGYGTTGIAAIETNRKFIGIEIMEKYFDVAVKRFEQRLTNSKEE